jgi:hypothetical protein
MAYEDPTQRQPKGDHNRRLSLGLDPDQFALEAGVTVEDLREYERTAPDDSFDIVVAERVGKALDRLEAVLPNGQTGRQETFAEYRVEDVVQERETPDEDFVVGREEPAPGEVHPMTQRGPDGRAHATPELEEWAKTESDQGDAERPPTPFRRMPD